MTPITNSPVETKLPTFEELVLAFFELETKVEKLEKIVEEQADRLASLEYDSSRLPDRDRISVVCDLDLEDVCENFPDLQQAVEAILETLEETG